MAHRGANSLSSRAARALRSSPYMPRIASFLFCVLAACSSGGGDPSPMLPDLTDTGLPPTGSDGGIAPPIPGRDAGPIDPGEGDGGGVYDFDAGTIEEALCPESSVVAMG